MQRAILEIKRIRTQLELNKFRIKQRLIYEAMGIEYHLELDELKSGGWVVDVWIDQRLVDSGEYFIVLLRCQFTHHCAAQFPCLAHARHRFS